MPLITTHCASVFPTFFPPAWQKTMLAGDMYVSPLYLTMLWFPTEIKAFKLDLHPGPSHKHQSVIRAELGEMVHLDGSLE